MRLGSFGFSALITGVGTVARAIPVVLALAGAAAAQQGGKLVVYSPHGDEIMNSVVARFTQKTGIEIEFLTAGGGELVDRVRAEKTNPVADVLYGNPSSVFMRLAEASVLQP